MEYHCSAIEEQNRVFCKKIDVKKNKSDSEKRGAIKVGEPAGGGTVDK
jgi:hypothetical protein